ncbi:MAG: DNA topoisomerase type IA central domain protein [Candidatus Parvarchaeum acidiphilum ARMAN-4]|uniref:DNA topoisomerase n=1 Tax=Candidatus Parvarchaeum acidiphilum ARMAN-4 TaxID=662760 RepID=D2EGP7_PARA4|nr:MAG: DNA topoisomerase type IA central domain protein [Candidatus Parvarchaeum acidiphilum ARMAN-4]
MTYTFGTTEDKLIYYYIYYSKMQLIIAEKSTAAETIAKNLAETKIRIQDFGPVKVWYTQINGEETVVMPLKGHIKNVRYPETFRKWNEETLMKMIDAKLVYYPTAEDNIAVIKKFAKKADKVIIATDYDTEGESIGFEAIDVVREENTKSKVYRSVFSSLTTKELSEAFKNLQKPNKDLSDSADARREIDLILGAVLTRFISLAAERLGNSFLSIGRVQTPTLAIIVARDSERRAFKPEKYWRFTATIQTKDAEFLAEYKDGKVFDEKTAEKLRKTKNEKKAVIDKVDMKKRRMPPPKPFNTTAFLRSAAAIGFSVPNAMRIVQGLYMKGYVSYPRTDSEAYPPTLDLKEILNELRNSSSYSKAVSEILKKPLNPTKGKEAKDHPPIHPVKLPNEKLNPQEARIFDLISRRFLATLSDESEEEIISIKLDIKGNEFTAKGSRILVPGWRSVYIFSKYEENILPEIKEGEILKVLKIDEIEDFTTPPGNYSQGAILKIMEDLNLGTKATRPEILKKLMERRYISASRTLIPSEVAFAVIENMQKVSNEITGAELTATLEKEMKLVEEGQKKKAEVVNESRDMLRKVLKNLQSKRKEIKELMHKALLQQYIFGTCPKSGGKLKLVVSKKSHKRFVGCSDYPKCHFGMPLPQSGYFFISPQSCPKCGIHMIEWHAKESKRTYIFCVNPACKVEKKEKAIAKEKTKK